MLLRWLPAAALLAVPLEAALLNQIDPLPPQTSPLTFAQSLKEAQDTFAAADKFFAAARLEHARDRESVERMERAVAQHQAEIPGMEFAGMQDPLPLPQIPQRTLPSAFAQSRKVSEAEIPGMEFAGMQDPLPLPQMPQRTLPSAFAQSRKVLEETPRPELAGMQDPLFWRQTPQRTLPSAFAQSRKVLEEIPRPELAGMQDPLPLRQTPQRRLPSAFMQSRKVSEEIPRTELAGMQDPLPLRQTPQRRLPSAFTQSRKVSEEIPRTELAGMQDPLPLRQTQQRTSPLAFAQSRKAAEDAWAAADKLFAAARLENTRDSVERVEHAVARARRHQAEIPGAEFAGMQAPPAADMHPCKMDCSNQGLCLAGKCMCRDGFYGDLCEHPRCLNDCSGHGQCLTGQCKCSSNYGGEDCSQLIQTQSSLAFLRRGLAAESAELAKQSSQSPSAKVSQVVTKACPLNCNSRGDCRDGTCECHDGWTGSSCQDYLQPALVDLTEGQSTSSCANQCSGHGVCESNGCKCHEGYRGEACDEAFQLEQPLQLKLQQVSKEDEQHTVTCPGGCGHGICKVGICDCDAGWQGTSCSISDEAALQGLEEQAALSNVPAAASWIGTGHADEVGTRALRAAPNQVTVPKTQLSAIQGQTEQGQRASSSFGVQAASALNRWLKSAKKVSSERPVDQLASLLSSAVAPPTD